MLLLLLLQYLLLSVVFFLLLNKCLLLLLLIQLHLGLLVLEHHDVKLLNVMVRVLSKVLIYEGLMETFLQFAMTEPKDPNCS